MALTRDFKQTVIERAQREPQFAQALFDEALNVVFRGGTQAQADSDHQNGRTSTRPQRRE